MEIAQLESEELELLDQVLGYLNFSSGNPDCSFLGSLNQLCGIIQKNARVQGTEETKRPLWDVLSGLLKDRLKTLQSETTTFAQAEQVEGVLATVAETLVGYLKFHSDLLFHFTQEELQSPLFLGRVCEAVLQQGAPWKGEAETQRIVSATISQLNDYIGYRPVATLETQKIEPYPHEWLRPYPIYIQGVGPAQGKYFDVVQIALDIIKDTDADILRGAQFDPDALHELAVDPRAYDFDHPANRRPNYHFGQWDQHQIGGDGRYHRFVVQQVTLDALMARVIDPEGIPAKEALFEAGAVLAGTMLMASGISGAGPGAFDSTTSLADLLPHIAAYRDNFYERLFTRVEGDHARRLRTEATKRRQPFGGARHHLNAQLALRRATQLEHVQLAKVFARIGFPEAAANQANVVPAPSARVSCRIDCRLAIGARAIEDDRLDEALSIAPDIIKLLKRGIECGAIIDPWNILGFDANFSFFPALENSTRDHRADDLVALMEQLFAFLSRLWSEAAAKNRVDVCEKVRDQFQSVVQWWRKYAAHEVSSVDAVDADDAFRAAEHVASALQVWHQGGAAAGDVAFWSQHAAMFETPKGYALVIDALLLRGDMVAAMALLVHWLGQGATLEQGESSFHRLAELWMAKLQKTALTPNENTDEQPSHEAQQKAWRQVRKFLDYLEANGEEYWQAPTFELGSPRKTSMEDLFAAGEGELEGDADDDDDVFGAAYEDMVYRDSTDDGVEGPIFDEGGGSVDSGLETETRRIAARLNFLSSMARLWRMAAVIPPVLKNEDAQSESSKQGDDAEAMRHWATLASTNCKQLIQLIELVEQHPVPAPSGDHDSLVEYDRHRSLKESLIDRVISTVVDLSDAQRLLVASSMAIATGDSGTKLLGQLENIDEDQRIASEVFACLLCRDTDGVRQLWHSLGDALAQQPLLYVPLSKGGNPTEIIAARVRQETVQDLLVWLPRQGLLKETCDLIETAREMERDNPVGSGAVTEFDELFKIGYKSIVASMAESATSWNDHCDVESELADCLEAITKTLLTSWLAHSRTLRLSVMEKVKDQHSWQTLVEFIKEYGGDLFTQRFFNYGNLRGILHQGVDSWFDQVLQHSGSEIDIKLFNELDESLERSYAVEHLSLVLEAIIENYGEYRDYNNTTTQSDRGELLYMLLDFLRLRTKYDRMSWNLRPVVWAHDILVRKSMHKAAELWRTSLVERIGGEAEKYVRRLCELQNKYAMRMPTVADRINERFLHPMAIDRIRALVAAAMAEAKTGGEHPNFDLLELETEQLAEDPTGVGLDIPGWLLALDEEVESVWHPEFDPRETAADCIPLAPLTPEKIKSQFVTWRDNEED